VSLLRSDGCLSCEHGHDLEVLLPHLAGVVVESAEVAGTLLCIRARARGNVAVCPGCGRSSRRVLLLAEFEDMAHQDAFSAFTGEYGIMGHCSGALIAYEIAKILARSPCRAPQLLVVSSCAAPSRIRDTGTSRLPPDELFSQTASMGGTPDLLMGDANFLKFKEPSLRADWKIYDEYIYPASARLPVPLLAIHASNDPHVELGDMELWRQETDKKFMIKNIDSGHWALGEEGSGALAKEISTALSEVRA
jgi:surfactin synthase thioesterase subunit